MIIKGERVTSSRAANPLLQHLMHGEENDCVALVQGTEEDVRAAFGDARDAKKKFALRHFIISPESETTRAEAMMVLGLLAQDFAFDPATAIVWEHVKPRAVVAAFGTHWHALVPEVVESATGTRVLDSRFSYLRHCKVARIAEHRLKQKFVRSNHEAACLAALESDGRLDVAAALREFIESDPGEAHREAFSRGTHQMGKRLGVDVPAARSAVRAAWETTADWNAFTDAVEAAGYRVIDGDRHDTEIVETHDGVFVGAAHRLARVRKIDFQRKKDLSNERTAETKSGPRDAGSDARRHPEDTVGAVNPGRQDAGGAAEARPSHRASVGHPNGGAGPSDQSGTAASEAGRGGPTYPGRFAVALRTALSRNPAAARDLLARARQLARAPRERVGAKLGRLDHQLNAELQNLTEPPLLSPELDAARRQLAEAKAHEEKISDLLDREKKRRARHMSGRPSGVMASIRGDTGAWAAGLAKIGAKLASLEERSRDAWSQRKARETVVAGLEMSFQRKKRVIRDSSEQQKRLLICRQKIARVATARQMLDKNPVLAFGGLAMLMAAAAAAATINNLLIEKIATDPSRKLI